MGLRFDSPWFLLLSIPAITLFVWMLRQHLRLSGLRKITAIGIRVFIILLLICTLSGLEGFITVERKTVVFVMDRSDSMEEEEALTDWMIAASQHKMDQDEIGVISVGAGALIERNSSLRDLQGFELNTKVNQQFTNLASGLQLAGSLISGDVSARIVMLSDGQENVGDVLNQAGLLRDKGIPIDVVMLDQVATKDVAIEQLKVPEQLYQGEKYTVEATLHSTYATQGELRIYEDNQEISSTSVQIERGENRYALQSLAKESGFHRYRAEIYVNEDTQSVNNASYAFSRVAGPPKVLVVEGTENSSHNLISILESSLIPYELIPPEMLSREFSKYTSYESIIFNNVSATRLAGEQMEMIEQAVRDYGIGFMMLGGEESFGLGGYFKTPIERTLPVYMDLRGKREIPSLGLVLVIDKSGSMSGGKMELAKEAAIRTVELMREQDTIGVLAFDGSPWWVVEPQKLTDREAIIDDISSIQESGGTEIYTAVEQGYQKLMDVEAQRKHMILLTDGQSSTNRSYEQLTSGMEANQITISTVAIGDGADGQLLERIAELGKGRYYFTNDQSTIPAIFSREAVLISRTYIVDQPFVPLLGQGGDWRTMFQQPLPTINAYIATTVKETAEAVLLSPEPDPLLARWQYGSGKSVAWTSDLSGKWSGDWLNWERLPQTFSEILKWTFPQFHSTPFQLTSRLEGDQAVIKVKSNAQDFQGKLKAVITDESLTQHEIDLIPTLPGEYEAEFMVRQPGVYLTRIDVFDELAEDGESSGESNDPTGTSNDPIEEQRLLGSVTTGFVIPYSPEYRVSNQLDLDKIEQLSEMTGGRILTLEHPEEVFSGEVQPKRNYYDLSYYLLMAALLLWVMDIAIRRLSIPWSSVFRIFHRKQELTATADKAARSVTVERLKHRKMKVHERFMNSEENQEFRQQNPIHRQPDLNYQSPLDAISEMDENEVIEQKNDSEDTNDRMNRLLAAKKRRNK